MVQRRPDRAALGRHPYHYRMCSFGKVVVASIPSCLLCVVSHVTVHARNNVPEGRRRDSGHGANRKSRCLLGFSRPTQRNDPRANRKGRLRGVPARIGPCAFSVAATCNLEFLIQYDSVGKEGSPPRVSRRGHANSVPLCCCADNSALTTASHPGPPIRFELQARAVWRVLSSYSGLGL